MKTLLLLLALMPDISVHKIVSSGGHRHDTGVGVQVETKDWDACCYIDGDSDVVLNYCDGERAFYWTYRPKGNP